MKIYILRHGETEWNVEHRFQGQLNSPLTENGIKKIKETGKELRNIKFDKIYTSEMGRAIETAKIVIGESKIEENKNKELIKMPELNEIHFGDWQGMTYGEILEKFQVNGNNYFNNIKEYDNRENNGEDLKEGLKRFLFGLEKIAKENSEKCVLVVTHGTVIELFLNYIENKDFNEIDERKLIENGKWKIFDYVDGKFIEII